MIQLLNTLPCHSCRDFEPEVSVKFDDDENSTLYLDGDRIMSLCRVFNILIANEYKIVHCKHINKCPKAIAYLERLKGGPNKE